MTAEERIVAACIESGVDDLISPGILRNLVRSIEEACAAALRERDAAWLAAFEMAAKEVDDIARSADDAAGAEFNRIGGNLRKAEEHLAVRDSARCIAARLRALLEEAGK